VGVRRGDVMWAPRWIWLRDLGGKGVAALFVTGWMRATGSDVRVSSYARRRSTTQPLAFSSWTFCRGYFFFSFSEEVFGFQRLSCLEKLYLALKSCLNGDWSANVRWNCFICPTQRHGDTEAQGVNDATVGASGVWASEARGGWVGGDVCSWNRIKAQGLLIPNSRFLPQNCHMLRQLKKLNIGRQRQRSNDAAPLSRCLHLLSDLCCEN